MRRIQVLGPGCPRCDELRQNVQRAVAELGLDATVEAVTDIEAIIACEALMTPALAIDGEVQAVGEILSSHQIKQLLTEHHQFKE